MAIVGATDITYNSYDLNTSSIITASIDDAQAPDRHLSIFNIVRKNGAVIADSQYYTKTIPVRGKLKAASNTALETLIDDFQSQMAVQDKNLDIGYAGSTRRYIATPAVVNIERPFRGSNWASFSIDFIATEYGSDTAATTLLNAVTRTGAYTYTEPVTMGGSAPQQSPIITITVSSLTIAATNTISIGNPVSGQTISISRTWANADILVVNCLNKTVTVNGVTTDYTGAFPVFTPGAGNLVITSDFIKTDTFTANGTYTAATGVTSASVAAWGGGGAGGGSIANGGAGGGGGGAYASSTVTVVPASGYAVAVGAAGTASTGAGGTGGNSTFATTTVVAAGGAGGAIGPSGAGGAGGTTAASTGTTKFAGGAGGAGNGSGGGGGGGGEGGGTTATGGAGAAAVSTSGGAGGTGGDGGDGGAGTGFAGGAGAAGSTPGGAGGGALRNGSNVSGGAGARGEVRVSYAGQSFSVTATYTKKYL